MDSVVMIGRLLVSLAAVLGLMWFIGRRMRKSGRAKPTQLIDVLGRQQLSRSASVAVVRVGEQALVVGVTDTQVSVLGETDLGAAMAMTSSTNEARTSAPRRTAGRGAGRHTGAAPAPIPTPVAPASVAAGVAATHAPAELPTDVTDALRADKPGALTGSALSPQTWRQTIDSLRELTTRQA